MGVYPETLQLNCLIDVIYKHVAYMAYLLHLHFDLHVDIITCPQNKSHACSNLFILHQSIPEMCIHPRVSSQCGKEEIVQELHREK